MVEGEAVGHHVMGTNEDCDDVRFDRLDGVDVPQRVGGVHRPAEQVGHERPETGRSLPARAAPRAACGGRRRSRCRPPRPAPTRWRARARSAGGSAAARRGGLRRGIATRRPAGVRVRREAVPPRRSTTRRSAVARHAAPRTATRRLRRCSGSVVMRPRSTTAASSRVPVPTRRGGTPRRGRSDAGAGGAARTASGP